MKHIKFMFLLLLLAGTTKSQVTGTWYGLLKVSGTQLRLVYHISSSGQDYKGSMDSPDQGVNGIPMDKVTFSGNILTVEAAQAGIKFTGVFIADSNKVKGTFFQRNLELPLELTRDKSAGNKATERDVRPQDPKDFPYKQEEVTINNTKAGVQLAGTLTMPFDGKVKKIVILISGSGPQNRNEEVLNHRPFLVWSDWLTRNHVAVLRYDDRGIGHSTGVHQKATTADFADDAEAVIQYIQSRADLKKLDIGLIGHSEGGMIAPMIASRNNTVKFIVLLASPGVPIDELMIQQNTDQTRLAGATPEQITKSSALNKMLYTAVKNYRNLPNAEFFTKLDTALYAIFRKFPASDLGGQTIQQVVNIYKAQLTDPWFKYFITFNPADYLTKVTCPVLALNGTLDMQVSCTVNLAAIKTSLQKAGNTRFETIPLKDLNHLFQHAITGAFSEYGQSAETVNTVALKKVSDWINQL